MQTPTFHKKLSDDISKLVISCNYRLTRQLLNENNNENVGLVNRRLLLIYDIVLVNLV